MFPLQNSKRHVFAFHIIITFSHVHINTYYFMYLSNGYNQGRIKGGSWFRGTPCAKPRIRVSPLNMIRIQWWYVYCLVPVILASRVRFHPYSPHQRTICMRVEIYGCPADGQFTSVINYRLLRIRIVDSDFFASGGSGSVLCLHSSIWIRDDHIFINRKRIFIVKTIFA